MFLFLFDTIYRRFITTNIEFDSNLHFGYMKNPLLNRRKVKNRVNSSKFFKKSAKTDGLMLLTNFTQFHIENSND